MANDKKSEISIAEEAGLDPDHWIPVNREPIVPGINNGLGAPSIRDIHTARDPYGTGPIGTPNFGLQTDLAKTDLAPAWGTVRLVPLQGGPGANAKTQGIVNTALRNAKVIK